MKAEEGRAAADVKDEAVVTHEAAGGPALAAPEPPSDEVLVARLRQLLTEVDLATTTGGWYEAAGSGPGRRSRHVGAAGLVRGGRSACHDRLAPIGRLGIRLAAKAAAQYHAVPQLSHQLHHLPGPLPHRLHPARPRADLSTLSQATCLYGGLCSSPATSPPSPVPCCPAEKQLRRRLEDEYGVDLAGRKKLLRSEINAYLEAAEGDQVGSKLGHGGAAPACVGAREAGVRQAGWRGPRPGWRQRAV